jgi:hypothetical protein
MSYDTNEILELPSRPNVKTSVDASGNTVTCWADSSSCESSDDVTYDRGFGG